MALIKCPDCQSDVSNAAPACPRCGYPVVAQTTEGTDNRLADERRTVHTNTPHPLNDRRSARDGVLDTAVLNRAGWLSILSAVISIPLLILSFVLESAGDIARMLNVLLSVAQLVLLVYLVSCLRNLLNIRFSFHQADSIIDWYIRLKILGTVLNVLMPRDMVGLAVVTGIVMAMAITIIEIAFGVLLLRMPGALYGLLKPYAYAIIVVGVCFGTIILAPLGLVGEVAKTVILAMIFFRAAQEQAEEPQPSQA